MFPTLERLRPLLQIETAVATVVPIAAVVWFIQFQSVGDAKDEESGLENKLRAAREDLRAWNPNPSLSELKAQNAALQLELESAQIAFSLPSQEDAMSFSTALLDYVSGN